MSTTTITTAPAADRLRKEQTIETFAAATRSLLDAARQEDAPPLREITQPLEEALAEIDPPIKREQLTGRECALQNLTQLIRELKTCEELHGILPDVEVHARRCSALAHAGRYLADGYAHFAPEDETNPPKPVTPAPLPDPAGDPVNGIRPGTLLEHRNGRRATLLTSAYAPWPEDPSYLMVRLSDPRDGTPGFTGHLVQLEAIGDTWRDASVVDAENADVDAVQVAFTVPVEVHVDLTTGEVTRVRVIHEEVVLDPAEGVRTEGDLRPVNAAIAARATEIADGDDTTWPTWG